MTVQGGATLRQHLKSGERASGRQVDRLHMELPAGSEHIWEWFLELCAGRQRQGGAPLPLSYAEVSAWAQLTGRAPTPFEVRTLKLLDLAFVEVAGEKNG